MCGERDIENWFRSHAHRDHFRNQHIVTCARLEIDDPVIGFYALSTVAESVKALPTSGLFDRTFGDDWYPCVNIVYFAIRAKHQQLTYGTQMMGHLIKRFAEIAEAVGIPALVVNPLNERVAGFYKRFGFEEYPKSKKLYLSLRVAQATIAQAVAEVEDEQLRDSAPPFAE